MRGGLAEVVEACGVGIGAQPLRRGLVGSLSSIGFSQADPMGLALSL